MIMRTKAAIATMAAAIPRIWSNMPTPLPLLAIGAEAAARGAAAAGAAAAGRGAAACAVTGAAAGAGAEAGAGVCACAGAAEGGGVGNLIVGDAVGFGGKLIRTVSFFG